MEELKREERPLFSGRSKKGEERAYIFNKEFKRKERITLLIVFLLTVTVLVFTFINNGVKNHAGYFNNWVRYNVIDNIIPSGFQPGIYFTPYSVFQPGIPFWALLSVTFMAFLPMSFRSRTRYAGAVCMMAASYLFAAFLWIYSFGLLWGTYEGLTYTVVGLILGYVGIIPIAFIIALIAVFTGVFEAVITMLVLAACFAAARIIMKYALGKYEDSIEGSGAASEQEC